jgi:uncharacterized protein YihD (DUF1040 family)
MRDPGRISKVLAELERYWRKHPDLRLAQLVVNLGIDNTYYTEDDELVAALQKHNAESGS